MKPLFLAIILLSLLTGCAPYAKDIHVTTEVGHNANLANYKNYIWLDNITAMEDPSGKWQPIGLDIAGEIKYAIDQELNESGLYLNAFDPQLAVTFKLGINMQALKLKFDPKSQLDILVNVPDAALLVFLIDAETQSIIWIGKAEAELQENDSKELVSKRIHYTISEMFKALNKKR